LTRLVALAWFFFCFVVSCQVVWGNAFPFMGTALLCAVWFLKAYFGWPTDKPKVFFHLVTSLNVE
jgi:uncharacterized membrane protein